MALNLGIQSNNYAEYTAVILCQLFHKLFSLPAGSIKADSDLVVRQIKGEWRVKDHDLSKLMQVSKSLGAVNMAWVRREFNTVADHLSKKATELDLQKMKIFYTID